MMGSPALPSYWAKENRSLSSQGRACVPWAKGGVTPTQTQKVEVTSATNEKLLETDYCATRSAVLTMPADQEESYGARPVKTRQAGAVPDSVPHQSPPSATGGPSRLSSGARGRRGKATGRKPQKKLLNVMNWNAEDAFSYKAEQQQVSHSSPALTL